MTNNRAADGESLPSAIDVSHLRPEQLQLLSTLLRAGEVPFGIARGELIAADSFADEIARALAWVAAPAHEEAAEFDDPEYRGTLPPLVKPSRPALPDGRRQTTRSRRLVAGVIDEVLVGVPTGLAASAKASAAAIVAVHMFYFVVPTSLFGWSLGKLLARTRVVDAGRYRSPGVWRAAVRWVVPYAPVMCGLVFGVPGDLIAIAVALVYLPIMLDLRGWHDRLANTLVVSN